MSASLATADLTGRKKAALLLIALGEENSSAVLKELRDHEVEEVALEVIAADKVPEKMQQDVVAAVLRKRLSGFITNDQRSAGGVTYLVRLLSKSDRKTERLILEHLDSTAPALAEEVRNQMFVFDNLVQLDDPSMQRLLREV